MPPREAPLGQPLPAIRCRGLVPRNIRELLCARPGDIFSGGLQHGKVTYQSSSPSREAYESVLVAAVWYPFFTRSTFPTVYDGLNDDLLSNSVLVRHARSNLFNNAAEFVSDGQRNLICLSSMAKKHESKDTHTLLSNRMRSGRTDGWAS